MSFGERFLRQAELFPARLAGDSWGAGELLLAAPGGPYLLTDLDAPALAALRDHFGAFCRSRRPGEPAAVTCRVLRVGPEEFLSVDTRGWELTLDFDREPQALRLAGPGLMARLEWRPELAAAVWADAGDRERLPGIVENVLRVLVAYRLADQGGALLHAAGVADGGDGVHVFIGHSGAGKTTLARLSQKAGKTVLSDDLVAISWREGSPIAEPLPFAGDLRPAAPLPAALPVRGLYRLVQGEAHRLADLGRAPALATLVACAPFVNRDPLAAEKVLSGLAKLLESVPMRLLTFARRPGVWAALEAA